MQISEILKEAVQRGASDIFLIAGRPATFKISGRLVPVTRQLLAADVLREWLKEIYVMAERDFEPLTKEGDDDFSFSLSGISRYRVSAYRQRGSLACVIRVVSFELPNPATIGIPEAVMRLSERTKGLILVTGPAGSGKSTTLACFIDRINHRRESHIITLEDPIEYLHRHDRSIVSQREVFTDTEDYLHGLRASLRQAPDVILLGEMRDLDTMQVAMTAAETGHLVFSTLHTVGAANTINRIIDVFPPNQQHQIRTQLSMVLQAVVSQQLVPSLTQGVVPAFEVMTTNNAVRTMIRENKVHQVDSVIQSSRHEGMISMDDSLLELYREGKIDARNAVLYSSNPEQMGKKVNTTE